MLAIIINPVAGVGGKAGLSGSDGAEIQSEATARGARPHASSRAAQALQVVASAFPNLELITAAGEMGEDAVRLAGLTPNVVYTPSTSATTPQDTIDAVQASIRAGATFIMFAGGDGTARNVIEGFSAAGADHSALAVIGIPSGVKMYSGVFAIGPQSAGFITQEWLSGSRTTLHRDVLDVDEDELRNSRVSPHYFGSLPVPAISARTQARKSATPASERAAVLAAAHGFVARMRPDTRYALGPGGTMQEVAQLLGYEKKPLGVDVVEDGEVIVRSASEQQLLDLLPRGSRVALSIIGGQGFILGRGNQQVSARLVKKLGRDAIDIVAPEQKLIDLHGKPLLVDTNDPEVDADLAGPIKIITSPTMTSLYRVEAVT